MPGGGHVRPARRSPALQLLLSAVMSSNAPSPTPSRKPKPVPERFQVAKTTLWFDRIMTKTIIGGGFTVIVAVFGILFFLLAVTIPLFQSADVEERQHPAPSSPVPGTWGLDPSGTLPFVYGNGKNIFFLDKTTGNLSSVPVSLPDGETVCAHSYDASLTAYPIATESGKVGLIHVHSGLNVHGRTNAHGPDKAGAEAGPLYPLTENGSVPGKISGIAYADAGERKIFTATVETEQGTRLLLMTLEESRSLLHEGELAPSGFHDLTDQLEGRPTAMLPGASGDSLVIATDADKLLYFSYDEDGETWVRRQMIPTPLGKGEKMTSVNWLFGDMSLVIGGDRGSLKIFSLYPHSRPDGTSLRLFGQTRQFSPMDGPVQHYAASGINRSFLVSTPRELRLCYGTTADIRWNSGPLEFVPVQLAANTEFNAAIAVDPSGNIHFFSLEDKHPEAGAKALVGKIWYEGYDSPKWLWQSVGGTDDYESKLSLMPLVFGTLKGTLYALVFAVPVAVTAAIYTAHFMAPAVKRVVKPVMEIMASLPSVVLGFFGALYLAPRMEDKVPALLCMAVLIPGLAALIAWFWTTRPAAWRNKFSRGVEYIVMTPVILLCAWFCWEYLGYWLEQPLISLCRSVMGLWGDGDFQAASFADLWRNGFGMPYEQRNSLVVGFIMGFAVIPVIFTISEDALSNVPPSLIAASEALGASRWQMVRTVVLPVASAGIFSALMIGLGRAVGETMIVLMATGNTPIMDWNIFNGMRTLSANIATELPEAAQDSTHYRVLFLGGLILFSMTFILNTLAEIVRQRLRKRFNVV